MADDSDEEQQPKRVIENQPYDELLEVPDAEEIASIYTPTPRHPKTQHQQQHQQQPVQNQQRSHLQPQQQLIRPTPPPTSSSASSGSFNKKAASKDNINSRNLDREDDNNNQQLQQIQHRPKPSKMSESPSDTPKPKVRTHGLSQENTDLRTDLQQLQFNNNSNNNFMVNNTAELDHSRTANNKNNGMTPVSTPSLSDNEPRNRNQMRNDMGDSESEGNESGDDCQETFNEVPGGYDPAAYRDLPVSSEIKDIFKLIERYQPQTIELDFKLKPFIPDYIPSIGDIDAFIKIPRPDGKQDNLGFTVVDEPSSNQSDPHVLDLFFRTLSKQSNEVKQPSTVKSVESNNTKAVESWIRNISALQKNKPVQSVNYQRAMPNIDSLMQIWPPEFEELLKEVSLPSPELSVDLNTYTDIICALLDIPVYKSKVQSLHVLFTLFSEFKNSQHFTTVAQSVNPYASTNYKSDDRKKRTDGDSYTADKLVID